MSSGRSHSTNCLIKVAKRFCIYSHSQPSFALVKESMQPDKNIKLIMKTKFPQNELYKSMSRSFSKYNSFDVKIRQSLKACYFVSDFTHVVWNLNTDITAGLVQYYHDSHFPLAMSICQLLKLNALLLLP